MSWVNWESYIVRSELGYLLKTATFERFRDHLNYYLLTLSRQGSNYLSLEVSNMDHVDWNSLVTAYSKGGKVDQKAILDWFKSELVDQVEKVAKAEETKRNFEKNMVKAIHAVYDEAGTDILPRPVVIEYALRELDVPIAQHDEAVMKMTNYIIGAKEFGTMQGPKGGMVRCLGADGKPTKTFNENKESIKFGRIVRKKNATRSTIP